MRRGQGQFLMLHVLMGPHLNVFFNLKSRELNFITSHEATTKQKQKPKQKKENEKLVGICCYLAHTELSSECLARSKVTKSLREPIAFLSAKEQMCGGMCECVCVRDTYIDTIFWFSLHRK